MDSDLFCKRSGHQLSMDMICIDKACPNQGLLCHQCFMEFPHHHMSSDILPIKKFVDNCDRALGRASVDISEIGEIQVSSIKEEFLSNKKLLESCRNSLEAKIQEIFADLEQHLLINFRDILEKYEGPKSKRFKEISKSQAILRDIQQGLVSQNSIRQLINCFDKKDNGDLFFSTPSVLKFDPKPSETHFASFKTENKRIRSILDKICSWSERIPLLINESIKNFIESPKIKIHEYNDKKPREKAEKTFEPFPSEDTAVGTKKKIKPSESISNLDIKSITLKTKETQSIGRSSTHNFCTLKRLYPSNDDYDHFKYLNIYAISFKIERDLILHGFGQWMISKPSNTQAIFEYSIIEGEFVDEDDFEGKMLKILFSGSFHLKYREGSQNIQNIIFEKGVKLSQNVSYTLKLLNKTKNIHFHCYSGIGGVEKRTPFLFSTSKSSEMVEIHSNVKKGQFPDFIYALT